MQIFHANRKLAHQQEGIFNTGMYSKTGSSTYNLKQCNPFNYLRSQPLQPLEWVKEAMGMYTSEQCSLPFQIIWAGSSKAFCISNATIFAEAQGLQFLLAYYLPGVKVIAPLVYFPYVQDTAQSIASDISEGNSIKLCKPSVVNPSFYTFLCASRTVHRILLLMHGWIQASVLRKPPTLSHI